MLFTRQPAEPSWPGTQPSSQTARAPPGPAAGHTTMLTRTLSLAHTAHMHPLKARSPTLLCDQTSSTEQERAHVQAVGGELAAEVKSGGGYNLKEQGPYSQTAYHTTPHHTTTSTTHEWHSSR